MSIHHWQRRHCLPDLSAIGCEVRASLAGMCCDEPSVDAVGCHEMSRMCQTKLPVQALSCQPQEVAMSIIRLIHIKIDPTEMEHALRVWKAECAPLMIQQKGCISEKLLRCREAHELISYSEWDNEADIELYRSSNAHKEIVRHARGLKGSKAEVKLYDLVT
jgi:heme-degrading monooxygenase HmoA